MNLSEIAIRRPVFTLMLMLALVVFGVLGYQTLPVNLLPSLDVPIVTVITLLPGASPEVMESDVTDVLESAVNTIEGIKSLTSFSGQGVSQITVTFTLDRNIDIAAQDVRDKVSGAVGNLPLDAEPPVVQKLDINRRHCGDRTGEPRTTRRDPRGREYRAGRPKHGALRVDRRLQPDDRGSPRGPAPTSSTSTPRRSSG